jgi:hypothetical protein
MNIPAHQAIDITPDEERHLNAIRQDFLAEMRPLDAKQQLARATVIAGGVRQRDPFTKALAMQIVEVDKLNRQAAEAQSEIDFINSSRRRIGVDPSPTELARREVLQRQVEEARARQIGIMENDFSSSKRKAVVAFREQAAERKKQQLLAEAIARQTAEAEQADIEARAAQLVRGKRLAAGKQPSKAGEAQ